MQQHQPITTAFVHNPPSGLQAIYLNLALPRKLPSSLRLRGTIVGVRTLTDETHDVFRNRHCTYSPLSRVSIIDGWVFPAQGGVAIKVTSIYVYLDTHMVICTPITTPHYSGKAASSDTNIHILLVVAPLHALQDASTDMGISIPCQEILFNLSS